MAGIEDITGQFGHHEIRETFQRLNEVYLKPIFLRPFVQKMQGLALLNLLEQLTEDDAKNFFVANSSDLGSNSNSGDHLAIESTDNSEISYVSGDDNSDFNKVPIASGAPCLDMHILDDSYSSGKVDSDLSIHRLLVESMSIPHQRRRSSVITRHMLPDVESSGSFDNVFIKRQFQNRLRQSISSKHRTHKANKRMRQYKKMVSQTKNKPNQESHENNVVQGQVNHDFSAMNIEENGETNLAYQLDKMHENEEMPHISKKEFAPIQNGYHNHEMIEEEEEEDMTVEKSHNGWHSPLQNGETLSWSLSEEECKTKCTFFISDEYDPDIQPTVAETTLPWKQQTGRLPISCSNNCISSMLNSDKNCEVHLTPEESGYKVTPPHLQSPMILQSNGECNGYHDFEDDDIRLPPPWKHSFDRNSENDSLIVEDNNSCSDDLDLLDKDINADIQESMLPPWRSLGIATGPVKSPSFSRESSQRQNSCNQSVRQSEAESHHSDLGYRKHSHLFETIHNTDFEDASEPRIECVIGCDDTDHVDHVQQWLNANSDALLIPPPPDEEIEHIDDI